MTDKKNQTLQEILRCMKKSSQAVQAMIDTNTAAGLRDAWEDFLNYYSRTIGKIVAAAKDVPASKAWGNRLKNASVKDDPGLVFLREARNLDTHGLVPFADFLPPAVLLGDGSISVAGNSRLKISNCIFNGRPSGNFELETKAGKIQSIRGNANTRFRENPASVYLRPLSIQREKKKIDVPVPDKIGLRNISTARPLEFAQIAQEVLEEKYEQLARIWRE